MQGSYHVGNTASRPISEVKQRWALLVLAWETSLEPSVTLRFFVFVRLRSRFSTDRSRGQDLPQRNKKNWETIMLLF